jgi:hypothetical protein
MQWNVGAIPAQAARLRPQQREVTPEEVYRFGKFSGRSSGSAAAVFGPEFTGPTSPISFSGAAGLSSAWAGGNGKRMLKAPTTRRPRRWR